MSHAISIERLLETLFVLEHVAHGSRPYCADHGIVSMEETGFPDDRSTWGLTKSVVCASLIEVAVRTRIILDYCYTINRSETTRLEEQACIGLSLSYDTKGEAQLSLRDTLNKIVHATLVRVDFSNSLDDPGDQTFCWDGQVSLDGIDRGTPWSHRLLLPSWCKAMARLLRELEGSESTVFLGQDFRP